MPPSGNFTINASRTSSRNMARTICLSWMFLTAGISAYGVTVALCSSSIGISFSLGVVASDSSASMGLRTSSDATIGVSTLAEALAGKLLLELLGVVGVREARRFTWTLLVLAAGGIATYLGSSNARLPLAFPAGCLSGYLHGGLLCKLFALCIPFCLLIGLIPFARRCCGAATLARWYRHFLFSCRCWGSPFGSFLRFSSFSFSIAVFSACIFWQPSAGLGDGAIDELEPVALVNLMFTFNAGFSTCRSTSSRSELNHAGFPTIASAASKPTVSTPSPTLSLAVALVNNELSVLLHTREDGVARCRSGAFA